MTNFAKSSLLLGVAVLALNACSSSKGPGALGTKDDIIVRNNGLPGATAPIPPSAEGEITSTVETAEAIPAAPVEQGQPLAMPEDQPLPSADPAVDAAAQKVAESRAPVPSTTTTPINDGTPTSTAPETQTVPADIVAPEPVAATNNVTPPASTPPAGTPIVPQDAPASAVSALNAQTVNQAVPAPTSSSVYPASDYAAGQQPVAPTTAPATSAPVGASEPAVVQPAPSAPAQGQYTYKPAPAGSTYKADPNAPYSPSAVVGANVESAAPTAPAPESAASPLNDPAVIKSAQAALKLKGAYTGPETGKIDAAFLNALSKYQGDNKLPQGGLNIDTLRHLGVVQ